MRRIAKKKINLNKLKTGCTPCMREAELMKKKISNRNLTEIKINEIKDIVSSIFKKN